MLALVNCNMCDGWALGMILVVFRISLLILVLMVVMIMILVLSSISI